uniref:Uncharacterized protein n=1 Tax=Vitis vinifera TaxID=29760 RepID=A5B0Z7_VITVI|nr:hypothetical protein VITISV_043862 [Vitis vinifera]
MEDILDGFAYEALQRELTAKEADHQGRPSKVRKLISTCLGIFNPNEVMRYINMRSKVLEITRRLRDISAQKSELRLEKVAAITNSARGRPVTASLGYEPQVYGRGTEKEIIIGMLLRNEPTKTNFSVVSIVATGGMGKTTLARLVYDDDKTVTKHFDKKAWVCVSDQFDAVRITKTILNSVTNSQSSDSQDLHQIQENLRKELKGKKFLIVLDDLWNDDYFELDRLCSPFWVGAQGSKILVTTRNNNVANKMRGHKILHELKQLPYDDCLKIFQTHAFEHMNIDEHPNLESIGRRIVEKCGGSPLAARALGGLLRSELRECEWERVLYSKVWNLTDKECDIIPALRLSYYHLSSHLKRCFTYCANFPQDYEFTKQELILLWIAEGLIEQSKDNRKMEDHGDKYFDELLSRSFFQSSSSNRSRFVMHDLVHALAKSIAGDTCLHLDDELWNDLQCPISENTRHSSFIRHFCDIFKKFERFHKKERLRTFIALSIDVPTSPNRCYISNKVLEELIPKLGHLRVLSLARYTISEIPDSFGKLKHLRYLNLSYTSIKWLPDSIGNLFYLQTLKLSCCKELIRLPISIGNLINLRHLDVAGAIRLQEMPIQIGKLKDLRILSNFIVDKNNGLTIKGLKDMSHLRGELCISKLENVVNIQDARDVDLKLKRNLESLIMQWSSELDGSGNERNQMDVLDSLQPCLNLNKLCIQFYGGPEFPRWIRDALFSKMVDLSLIDCRKCTSLPCLGQLPSLKQLRIQRMDGVKKVGAEFYGETRVSGGKFFPSLESLHFKSMSEWEHWEDWSSSTESLFPCLHELIIEYCPKLIMKLPTYLPSLTKLSVHFCPKLESPLSRLPLLKKLQVRQCNEAVLSKLTISEISGLIKLHEGFVQVLQGLRVLKVSECEELVYLWEDGFGSENSHSLEIRDCDQLVSLGCNLQSLEIIKCDKLERLPNGWQSLTCLEKLAIRDCPKLASFPDVGFPPKLRSLTVGNCKGLKSLPDGMMLKMRNDSTDSNNLCLLECLSIWNCPSLICFPKGQLPTTLKSLRIKFCDDLKSLPEGMMGMCALEELTIVRCPSLIGLPKGGLPATLKMLIIFDCRRLKSLPEGIMHQHSTNAAALQALEICTCPSLTSFPRGKFPSTLKRLHIRGCKHLESISEGMFHSTNNSLQSLILGRYPNLKTLPDCLNTLTYLVIEDSENLELLLPQIKNLTCLTSLIIQDCENIKTPLSQWGLSRLTSLKRLWISGMFPDATSFSDDPHSILFPTTLTSLILSRFQNLESLASLSLQTLTSLEELEIYDCPKLRSILPREGLLPDTLSRLHARRCPHLTQMYSKEEGDDWLKIAHIPCHLLEKGEEWRYIDLIPNQSATSPIHSQVAHPIGHPVGAAMSKKMYVIQIFEEKYLNLETTGVFTTSEFLT